MITIVRTKSGISLAAPIGDLGKQLMDSCHWTPRQTTTEVLPKILGENPKRMLDEGNLVNLTCPPGTKSTDMYIKTPSWLGKDRWFEKAKIDCWSEDADGLITIRLLRADVKVRGLAGLLAS